MNADRTNADGIVEQLARQDYCHCAASQEWIAVEPEEEKSFKAYWDNLAEDENFKTTPAASGGFCSFPPARPTAATERRRGLSLHGEIRHRLQTGAESFAVCRRGFIHHPLLQRIVATDIAMMRPGWRPIGSMRSIFISFGSRRKRQQQPNHLRHSSGRHGVDLHAFYSERGHAAGGI